MGRAVAHTARRVRILVGFFLRGVQNIYHSKPSGKLGFYVAKTQLSILRMQIS